MLGLAHYSVQEYLVSRRCQEGPAAFYKILVIPAHALLAETCLTYLSSFDGSRPGNREQYPLLLYAASNWYRHLLAVPQDTERLSLTSLACELLDYRATEAFRNWLEVHRPVIYWNDHQPLFDFGPATQPPHNYACFWGMVEVVRLLLERGADVNCKDVAHKRTALMVAVAAGQTQVVEFLVQKGADADPLSVSGDTAASEASGTTRQTADQILPLSSSDDQVSRLLPGKNTYIDAEDIFGDTALHIAAERGVESLVQLLLSAGANIQAQDQIGETALMTAIESGRETIVQRLLEAGADIHAHNHRGLTPLNVAVLRGNDEITELLLKWNAKTEVRDLGGMTALHKACTLGMRRKVELLLEAGANIEAQDNRGQTPLTIAIWRQSDELIQLLLKWNAKTEVRDRKSRTALHIACDNFEMTEEIELSLGAGADIVAQDNCGQTPHNSDSETK